MTNGVTDLSLSLNSGALYEARPPLTPEVEGGVTRIIRRLIRWRLVKGMETIQTGHAPNQVDCSSLAE